jgi:hypothetical protein
LKTWEVISYYFSLGCWERKNEGNFFFLSKEENLIGILFSGGIPVSESCFLLKTPVPEDLVGHILVFFTWMLIRSQAEVFQTEAELLSGPRPLSGCGCVTLRVRTPIEL